MGQRVWMVCGAPLRSLGGDVGNAFAGLL